MEIDNCLVMVIINTGLQLNIVSQRICKTHVQQLINSSFAGVVENVPLHCGGVRTVVNLYVGKCVPFDLLLRWPWQQGNYISIDEQSDGTYLLFKNQDLEVQQKIMVAPNESNSPWSNDVIANLANTEQVSKQQM